MRIVYLENSSNETVVPEGCLPNWIESNKGWEVHSIMQISDHFGVAHLVGHTAFDHLNSAGYVYEKARQSNLLDTSTYTWQDCLEYGAKLTTLRMEERRSCVQAVILFQAMMEKAIYFVPNVGSGLKSVGKGSFAAKWGNLLSQIKSDNSRTTAEAAFDTYNRAFYKAFRNPIIHGDKAKDIRSVDQIRMPEVHEGMRQGWQAYDYLLAEAFAPEQQHEPSWKVMCDAHATPHVLNISNYPDLTEISNQFNKKHLDGARKAAEG